MTQNRITAIAFVSLLVLAACTAGADPTEPTLRVQETESDCNNPRYIIGTPEHDAACTIGVRHFYVCVRITAR